MKVAIRILSILIGLVFLLNGAQFVFDPAAATSGLGMDLLTGVGASTQLGDIGGFFFAVAIMIGLAQRPGESRWFYPAALLLASAALMRTLAWLTGSADIAPQFIVSEVVMTAILLLAAHMRADEMGPVGAQ